MTSIWFVEERNIFGGWGPATYRGEKPTEKQLGGHRRKFRNPPEKVNTGHHDLTLPQLFQIYSPQGRFYLPRMNAMTPDMMTDALSRAQDKLKAYEAACRKALPLIEAAGREEVTDWDEAEDMIRAALGEKRT